MSEKGAKPVIELRSLNVAEVPFSLPPGIPLLEEDLGSSP